MGLQKLLTNLSEGVQDYPNHNLPTDGGGFNYGESFTPIFEGQFRQKSFDFGKGTAFDRPDQDFSSQPFIKNSIFNFGDGGLVTTVDALTDGLVRGGIVTATERSLQDVERITKFLLTPQGLGFLTKQVGLQASNPKIRGGGNIFNEPASNQRTYNLGINTLASVLGSAAGIRFKREGLKPLSNPEKFEGYITDLELTKENSSENRLIGLFENHITSENEENILYEYKGGPNSIYGLGQTTINKYLSTTFESQFPISELDEEETSLDPNTSGAGIDFSKYNFEDNDEDINESNLPTNPTEPNFENLKPPRDIGGKENKIKKYRTRQGSIKEYHVNLATNAFEDFKNLNSQPILLNKSNYPVDGIKDFIPFRFEAVNTENPQSSDFIVFKAFLDTFNDNYGAEHNSFNYNGRGETFYTYNGFTRNIDFSFKIAAQSKNELRPLYQKLNYLLSNTAPEYSKAGRMRTPFIKLTVGDWCNRVPGILTSIGLSWQKDYSWDLGEGPNSSGLILPHVLDVNVQFTPIHQFMPEKSFISSEDSNLLINTPFINT